MYMATCVGSARACALQTSHAASRVSSARSSRHQCGEGLPAPTHPATAQSGSTFAARVCVGTTSGVKMDPKAPLVIAADHRTGPVYYKIVAWLDTLRERARASSGACCFGGLLSGI